MTRARRAAQGRFREQFSAGCLRQTLRAAQRRFKQASLARQRLLERRIEERPADIETDLPNNPRYADCHFQTQQHAVRRELSRREAAIVVRSTPAIDSEGAGERLFPQWPSDQEFLDALELEEM
jgi:hypothetical protein